MAKTIIKGRFATAADAAAVHQISEARRDWLDREIDRATADVAVYFVPLVAKANGSKRSGLKRSAATARMRAKRK